MRSPTRFVAGAAAGVFAIGAVAGWVAPAIIKNAQAADSAGASAPAAMVQAGPIPLGTAPNYHAIVAQNRGSVVGITVAGELKAAAEQPQPFGGNPFGDDDNNPFSQFFRQMPHPHGNQQMHAQGSGFIVSSDGLILTNAHVVDGAKEVTVKLMDHREFKAKVLGTDKTSDIAVLKIEAHGLPAVRLGNSDALGVGDYVLAIGAPFGLEETATAGIVSATGRSLPGDGAVPFIQTDAAVNPGNSGGPLFDSTGAVVGINSQIYTNSGGYQGVSFAIPINLAQGVEQQIVKTGKVEHGRLGVEIQNVNQSLAQSFKLSSPAGALVAQVVPDSAAARAGIKAGRRDPEVQRIADRGFRRVVGARECHGARREGDARHRARWQADEHQRDHRLGEQRHGGEERRGGSRRIASRDEAAPLVAGRAQSGRRFGGSRRRGVERTCSRGGYPGRATWCCRSTARRSTAWISCGSSCTVMVIRWPC